MHWALEEIDNLGTNDYSKVLHKGNCTFVASLTVSSLEPDHWHI